MYVFDLSPCVCRKSGWVFLFRYFEDDDEEEGVNDPACEYQPAPGSPGPEGGDASDASDDPLDAFMASLEVR